MVSRKRFIRVFPGRMRTEIFGLLDNAQIAKEITRRLLQLPGVTEVRPCTITGRAVIVFDPKQISVQTICETIQEIELFFMECPEMCDQLDSVCSEAAVTKEQEAAAEKEQVEKQFEQVVIPESFQTMAMPAKKEKKESIPPGLILSLGGLGVLAVKQLISGKSTLSRHPGLFAASGILSVITGYPFLRRGIQKLGNERKWNSDVLLGTAALGLGLLRENLLVLAGLSILQFIYWKRKQLEQMGKVEEYADEQYLSPRIRKYSDAMGKWAFPIAGLTWAFTKNPFCGLAVLLAANPRLAIIPTIAKWKQAENEVVSEGTPLPYNGTLSQLAHAKTVLIEDTSQLFLRSSKELQIDSPAGEEGRVWNLAASLLAKSNHSWKTEVVEKARTLRKTIRTAFDVIEEPQGICGRIHQHTYYFGTLAYLQKQKVNVDPFVLKLKQMEKRRTQAYALVRKEEQGYTCLGILYQEHDPPTKEFLSIKKHLSKLNRNMAVWKNSLKLDEKVLKSYGLDTTWLHLNRQEVFERIQASREQGEEIVVISENPASSKVLAFDQRYFRDLPQLFQRADQIEQQVNQQFTLTKLFHLGGIIAAIPLQASAMIINLVADAISLLFLSRIREKEVQLRPALAEVAATASAEATFPPRSWHEANPQEVASFFAVDEQYGLTSEQVALYRQKAGWNLLEHQKSAPWWKAYLGQFKQFTSLLLLGTTVLSFLTGDPFNGIAVGIVLLLNALVGTIQEQKAEKVVEALNQNHAPQCKVIRDGKEQVIDGKELVPGDLVVLEAGDRVPADLRLIQCWSLEVDESMLTGESIPVPKTIEPIVGECPLTDRTNMLFQGTGVIRGRGLGIVVSTGMQTEMGALMRLMKGQEHQPTPLQQEVTQISKTFVKAALAIALLIFGIGLLRGNPLLSMVPTTIALAASAIPEGLPVTVTIALSAGIFRMAQKGVLIRKLSTLEALGRATVICTDKTGTLTKNEMTVRKVATFGQEWNVTGEGYSPEGELKAVGTETEKSKADLAKLIQVAALCNNSTLTQEDGKWSIQGDPTEGALITLAHKAGYRDPFAGWTRVHEVPFDSAHAKMSVVCQEATESGDRQECFVLTKGSVETILRLAQFVQIDGEIVPLMEEHKQKILVKNEEWAKSALRVLAFAYRPVDWDGNGDGIENDLIFVGMVGMIDPPKKGIEQSIAEAIQLGAKPVMITGDHPLTAFTIAREIGFGENPKVMTGQELDSLSDEELTERIEQIDVFARVTPEHKLRIVRAYQHLGHIVAMTGDGVNDSPAIKQADIGICMGQTGTEVTKETADMVLKEDDFRGIVEGVKEGRTIISNIRKALGCLLTGNFAEVLVTGIAVIAGLSLPLIPIQILVMNLLTDALPAMVLAMNPGEKEKQTERVVLADRDLYTKVVVRGALLGLGSLGMFVTSLAAGASLPVAQTIALASLVIGQLIQTFSWRKENSKEKPWDMVKDKYLLWATGASILVFLSIMYVPVFNTFFHTAPLNPAQWLHILLVAGSVTTLSRPIVALAKKWKGKQKEQPAFAAA